MAKRTVARGTAKKAVRQPGANTGVPRNTNAGNAGNVADGNGTVSNRRLSGAEDGGTSGTRMASGTP